MGLCTAAFLVTDVQGGGSFVTGEDHTGTGDEERGEVGSELREESGDEDGRYDAIFSAFTLIAFVMEVACAPVWLYWTCCTEQNWSN